MPINLRPPRPGDLDRLVEIEMAAFSGDRLSRRSLGRLTSGASSRMIVAEMDGRPVGYALVLLRRGVRSARLYSIAVDPARTGTGIGARLLAAAEKEATAAGRLVMRLEVRADNSAAIALYRSKGYAEIGRHAAYYEDAGEALRMEKQLCGHEALHGNRPEAAR